MYYFRSKVHELYRISEDLLAVPPLRFCPSSQQRDVNMLGRGRPSGEHGKMKRT